MFCDCRMTSVRVSPNCGIINSPKFLGNSFATLARLSYDSLAMGSRIFWRKNLHTFFNMFKTFATSS